MAWDYPNNYSNGNSVDSVSGIFNYGNYLTGGSFAYGILIVIFFISSIPFMMANSRKAFAAGSFVTLIFSVYFMRIGMISISVVISIAILTIILAFVGKGEGQTSL